MKAILYACLALALTNPALAQQPQQPPDPVLLQKLIGSLQVQRNQALDAAAVAEARAVMANDELAKAQAAAKDAKPKDEKPPK